MPLIHLINHQSLGACLKKLGEKMSWVKIHPTAAYYVITCAHETGKNDFMPYKYQVFLRNFAQICALTAPSCFTKTKHNDTSFHTSLLMCPSGHCSLSQWASRIENKAFYSFYCMRYKQALRISYMQSLSCIILTMWLETLADFSPDHCT